MLKGLRPQHGPAVREPEKNPMRHSLRYVTLFLFTSFTALTSLGGCSEIGEAIDCEQMCDEFQTCIDGDLDVHRCSDRCEDKADTSSFRDQLDECTDCLDQNYACGEVPDKCPACAGVTEALL